MKITHVLNIWSAPQFVPRIVCATNVHLIPASGDDEVYHIHLSRAGMRPGGPVYITLFNMVLVMLVHSANRSSSLEFLFLSLHLSPLSVVACRYWGCTYHLADCRMSPCSPRGPPLLEDMH